MTMHLHTRFDDRIILSIIYESSTDEIVTEFQFRKYPTIRRQQDDIPPVNKM